MGKVAVALLVLLIVVVGLPVAAGHTMTWCPECLFASALSGMILCLTVLTAGLVLMPLRVEWLRGPCQPCPRLLALALFDRPPRSA